MFAVTRDAVEAVRAAVDALSAPESAGIRISLAPHSFNGHGPSIAVELVDAPGADDEMLYGDGAKVFVAPEAAGALEDKVLDAEIAPQGQIKFAILDQD